MKHMRAVSSVFCNLQLIKTEKLTNSILLINDAKTLIFYRLTDTEALMYKVTYVTHKSMESNKKSKTRRVEKPGKSEPYHRQCRFLYYVHMHIYEYECVRFGQLLLVILDLAVIVYRLFYQLVLVFSSMQNKERVLESESRTVYAAHPGTSTFFFHLY